MKAQRYVALLFLGVTSGVLANPACQFEATTAGTQKIGTWIDKRNWLDGIHRRVSLQAGDVFMPGRRLTATGDPFKASAKPLNLDKIEAPAALDGSNRNLEFLLDSHVQADGIVVLHRGQIVVEQYRHGLRPESPRLLLDATRPLLNVLGSISLAQGKLSADRSVSRVIPELSPSTGLRKISIQRLLENEYAQAWSTDDMAGWRQVAGWSGKTAGDMHAWLAAPGRWDKPPVPRADADPLAPFTPEDDLLAWVLTESNRQPLAPLFCEQLQSRHRPEHPVFWTTDAKGVELGNGLALSLRDFARFGQVLLDARTNRNQSRIPAWFVETLAAPAGGGASALPGLPKGSELRYGFVRLGGRSNAVALIGRDGASLFIDFDQRIVVGIYADYSPALQPSLLASLDTIWKAIDRALIKRQP